MVEKDAMEAYKKKMIAAKHQDFEIKSCGFFVDSTSSFIGATPDGLVHCIHAADWELLSLNAPCVPKTLVN